MRTTAGIRIQPLPRTVRRIWLVLHVVCSVGWIGVEIAVLTLCIAGLAAGDPGQVSAMFAAASLLANVFFLPGTLVVLVTGIVLGVGTKWGLVKHYWVFAKLLIALVLMVGAGFILRGRINELSGTDPAASGVSLFGSFTLAGSLFLTAVVLSILKPWGRVNWRRIPARTAHPQQQESS